VASEEGEWRYGNCPFELPDFVIRLLLICKEGLDLGPTLDTIIPMGWGTICRCEWNEYLGLDNWVVYGVEELCNKSMCHDWFSFVLQPSHKQSSLRRSLYPAPPTRPPPFSDQHSLEYATKKIWSYGGQQWRGPALHNSGRCCDAPMVEMGWKVADEHLVPLFYIRKGNNCFRRIGNEEIFTT
jgi:hypothetical protein